MPLRPYAFAGFLVMGGLAVVEGARLCPCGGGSARAQVPATASRTVTLHIDGMDCPACTTAVRIALKKLDGVEEAKVSYSDKQAVVEYTPGKVTPQQLAEAVNRLGYKAILPGKGS